MALMLLLSAKAWSCSCSYIASIEDTIADSPILVEAQVMSLEETKSAEYGRLVHGATLRVTKRLKGLGGAQTIIVGNVMCYASLYPELMKVRHTYILPLFPLMNGHFQMPGCAHSGMELIDGKLYTFEHTVGLQRRLKFYMMYSQFLVGYR